MFDAEALIARLEAATKNIPALWESATMALMLVAYPSALTNLKDTESVYIMLTLGAGHLAALWCCIAALRAKGGGA